MAQDQTVQDLQADNNRNHRLFERFSSESKSVSISIVALIVAALALLMAWMAVYDAIHAKIQVVVVLESNAGLVREVRILQNKIDRYEAKLEAEGDE